MKDITTISITLGIVRQGHGFPYKIEKCTAKAACRYTVYPLCLHGFKHLFSAFHVEKSVSSTTHRNIHYRL